jgi:hypothetical protein
VLITEKHEDPAMANIKSFQEDIQAKIRSLLKEFGEGKISSEQFNIIYQRYNNQLEMALEVIDGTSQATSGPEMSTIAIKQATTGKAIGLAIYHHRSGTIVETLGSFELPPDVISPVVNEFSDKLEARQFIEPVIKKLPGGLWVVFMAKSFTTAIVVFRNEPAQRQVRELQRLLHDFEEANRQFLDKMNVDKDKLAKPFIGIVKKKLGS